jgi:hypothetical protein
VTAYGMRASRDTPESGNPEAQQGAAEQAAVLGAVREDVRQTLRTGWLDPALEVAAARPVFFTAAWSAIRPNVGKSFLSLTRALRTEAADWVRATQEPPDLRKRLELSLSEEEMRRIDESARAAHQILPKVQIVVHVLHRAARRERLAGTGREEPPVRRGVPDWQRWMSIQPSPDSSHSMLGEAKELLGLPSVPSTLRLFARWPVALDALWSEIKPFVTSEALAAGTTRLRRKVMVGISTLPHPVDLQWMALRERGFTEEDRVELAEAMGAYDAGMAKQTMMAAFAWLSFGAPEIGVEG